MANKGRPADASKSEVPRDFANVPPPASPMLDHSFTLQAVMEIQKTIAELCTKTDRLIADVAGQGKKIDTVSHQISFVRGVIWVLGFVILALTALATWYFSGKLAITIKP